MIWKSVEEITELNEAVLVEVDRLKWKYCLNRNTGFTVAFIYANDKHKTKQCNNNAGSNVYTWKHFKNVVNSKKQLLQQTDTILIGDKRKIGKCIKRYLLVERHYINAFMTYALSTRKHIKY